MFTKGDAHWSGPKWIRSQVSNLNRFKRNGLQIIYQKKRDINVQTLNAFRRFAFYSFFTLGEIWIRRCTRETKQQPRQKVKAGECSLKKTKTVPSGGKIKRAFWGGSVPLRSTEKMIERQLLQSNATVHHAQYVLSQTVIIGGIDINVFIEVIKFVFPVPRKKIYKHKKNS